LGKSVGKLVLFRSEDLKDPLSNLTVKLLEENNMTAEEWAMCGAEKIYDEKLGEYVSGPNVNPCGSKIIRSLTNNYQVVNGALESPIQYVNIHKIARYSSDRQVVFLPMNRIMWNGELIYTKDTIPNLSEYDQQNNPYGIETSPYSFLNHNLSLQRPSTTVNEDFSKYGFDDEISIKPIYNFYLKEYEKYFSEQGVFWAPDRDYEPEKTIPNFYYTFLAVQNLNFDLLLSRMLIPKPPEEQVSLGTMTDSAGGTQGVVYLGANGEYTKVRGTIDWYLKSIVYYITNGPFEEKSSYDVSPNIWSKLSKETFGELYFESERNSVVLLTSDFYKKYNTEIENQKNKFPYYNEIKIPVVKKGTVFREIFKQANLYDNLQFAVAILVKIIKFLKYKLDDDTLSNFYKDYNLFKLLNEDVDNKLISSWESKEISLLEFAFNLIEETSLPDYTQLDSGYDKPGQAPLANGKNYFDISNIGVRQKLQNTNLFTNIFSDIKTLAPSKIIGDEPVPSEVNKLDAPLAFYGQEKEKNNYISSLSLNKLMMFLKNKLLEQIKLNAASVFKNNENYSEILFFEVVKYKAPIAGEGLGLPIQTFILPNDPDFDQVKYYDTQIKYKFPYIYQIYAHTLSIGNQLQRSAPVSNAWQYDNEVDAKWLRVPYYNIGEIDGPDGEQNDQLEEDGPVYRVVGSKTGVSTINVDSPPLPLNVTFFPYKNISNKIGFWFNVQIGELMMTPYIDMDVGSTQTEQAQSHNVKLSAASQFGYPKVSGYGGLDFPILYKTDDYGGTFEVFRTTKRPKSYVDFKGKKISDIEVIGNKTFIDDIVPNQDYYYTFRTVDVHNMPSNPTPVYHIKMITHNDTPEANAIRIGSDSAQPILFSEIICLDDNYEKKIEKKSFKKYLLLEPSLNQAFLKFDNFEKEDGFNTADDVKDKQEELKFGNAQQAPLFGKKFKIRITSKQTGRKLDINANFKNIRINENITNND